MPPDALSLPIHRLHDEEVERLLVTGERREELVALFGERGYRELRSLARRAATRSRARSGPRVYVLPGLMGSRLGTRGVLLDDVLWVDLLEIAAGHLTRLALPGGNRLVALGAMLLNTLKLKLSLQIAGFDTRVHAFDWRRSIGELAAQLNTRIAAESRSGNVMLVGHSMGGVVARVALGRQQGTRIARVVQLGAPNHGSFAPVLALRGVYPTVRKLAALDRRHSAEDLARIVFRSLPALHELLPDPRLAGGPNLFDAEQWPRDALRPDAAMLERAAREQAAWPPADERCLHVVGVRQETVVGTVLHTREFEYTLSLQGDATVPVALATQPPQPAWYVGEQHGGLPNNGRVIAAVVDLLRTGTTSRLARSTSLARLRESRPLREAALRRIAPHKVKWQYLSADARRRLLEPVVSPEFHGIVVPATLEQAFAARRAGLPAAQSRVLELRVTRSSIVEANARAIVLGVFRNVDPTGAAAALDAALGGVIRQFTLRRMFSARLGAVFALPVARGTVAAELVLFAGLGDFDSYGSEAQAFAAENVVRTFAQTHVEDFATTLVGAGSGLPVAMATEEQLRGYLSGLRDADPQGVIRRITFCEIDRRKYGVMLRTLRRLAREWSDPDFGILVDEADTAPQAPSPASSRRVARTSRATTAMTSDPAYLLVTCTDASRTALTCRSSLLTAGAKAAVLSGATTFERAELARSVAPLERGSASPRDLPAIGDNLAELLLPARVRDGLATMRSRRLVVVHDREASRVPWEVLRIDGSHPALTAGLSRRYASDTLSVARWRDEPTTADVLRVLLIVNPTGDLPGAADEGHAVDALLRGSNAHVDVLEGRDASRARILAALARGTYDVMHFAGHAFFEPDAPGKGGLLCADEEVLHGADLEHLSHLPALVFCNACEAARVRRAPARRGSRRAARWFASRRSVSGVGEAILSGGVANFLGTHWPVGDASAFAFSGELYRRLLRGDLLGEAVLAGRRQLFALPSLDWADYVHYGNPDFRLTSPRQPETRRSGALP